MKQDDAFLKAKKAYGLILTSSLLLVILHLIGMVVVQSMTHINDEGDAFQTVPVFGLLYGSSCLSCLISSSKLDLKAVNSVAGVCSLSMAILSLLFLYYAQKGKHVCFWIYSGMYTVDTLLLIPVFLFRHRYPISLTTVDVVLLILFHTLGMAIVVLGVYDSVCLKRREKATLLYSARDDHDPTKGL